MGQSLGREFRWLWAASGLSNLGDGVVLLAVPLITVQLTRSPLLVSLVSAAATLPWLLLALHAGALADRWDRRRIMLAASWLRAVVLAAVAIAAAINQLSLPLLCALVLILGTAEVFSDIAAQSMLPTLVDRERLGAANGRLVATQMVGNEFLGAPLAGVLVGLAATAAFGAPALIYAAAGLLLLGLKGHFVVGEPSSATLRADITEGLRYLARHRVLRAMAILVGVSNLAYAAYFAVFLLWAVGPQSAIGLTEAGYGVLFALLAVGAVVGSVAAEWTSRLVGETRLLIGGLTLNSLLLLVPVFFPAVSAVAVAVVFIGATNAATKVLFVSLRQRLIPEHLMGRVNAAYRMVGMGTMPLGALLGGLVGGLTSLPVVFCGAVGVCLVATACAARDITPAAVSRS